MNDTPLPPKIPAFIDPSTKPTVQDDAEDKVPITGVFGAVEALLRRPGRVMHQLRGVGPARVISALLFIAVGCSLAYGIVVGTFSGGTQLWAAPVKIVIGLMISGLICLPSLYIFSCLSGSQARLVDVFGLIAGLLALMTILLIGFAPVAWVFSQSTESIAAMGALHILFWLIATGFGLRFLQAGFRHLSAKSDGGFFVWAIIFVLVMLQMTTALRPIIGTSETFLPKEKRFFLSHWFETLDKADSMRTR